MAKTQLKNYMESHVPHVKLDFATTARCSTPVRSDKKTRTINRPTSVTCEDSTTDFKVEFSGLNSKLNKCTRNQTRVVQQNSKEKVISPPEQLLIFATASTRKLFGFFICPPHLFF